MYLHKICEQQQLGKFITPRQRLFGVVRFQRHDQPYIAISRNGSGITNLFPIWKEIGKLAEEHSVKIGIELHGGFLCHTPYTILKLREETCDAIGVNLDPSHLWWQGIGPVGAIHHFHARILIWIRTTSTCMDCWICNLTVMCRPEPGLSAL